MSKIPFLFGQKLILKAAAMIGEEVNIEIIKEEDLGDSLLFVELKHLKREVSFKE